MQKVTIEPFKVIGIAVRTSNQNGQAAQEIPALWNQFMTTGVAEKIPNKTGSEIYSIYTNYEGDHMQPYDTVLAMQVSSLNDIPEGMVGHAFDGGTYQEFPAKGDLTQGVVYDCWLKIWDEELDRTYTADFEVYGEKAQNPNDAELSIFVAVNA